jgi:hypothetical protein
MGEWLISRMRAGDIIASGNTDVVVIQPTTSDAAGAINHPCRADLPCGAWKVGTQFIDLSKPLRAGQALALRLAAHGAPSRFLQGRFRADTGGSSVDSGPKIRADATNDSCSVRQDPGAGVVDTHANPLGIPS